LTDLLYIPGFTKKRLIGSCIAGPAIGLMLYGVLRVSGGWQYTPVVFLSVFILAMGSFATWAWYYGDE
jgi:hypothetical protein